MSHIVPLPVFVYSEPEMLTASSSARSFDFFFAFFRLLRSLSRCFALFISLFDRPGLFMSSSYMTHHYYVKQVRMGAEPCLTRCVVQSFCSAPENAFLGTIRVFPWVYATTGRYSVSCLWIAHRDRRLCCTLEFDAKHFTHSTRLGRMTLLNHSH